MFISFKDSNIQAVLGVSIATEATKVQIKDFEQIVLFLGDFSLEIKQKRLIPKQ